jgi:tetratricopeptide (TPR) repeat protein
MLVLAQEMDKSDLELEGHHTLWGTFSLTGDMAAARLHAERGIELYRFEQHGDYGFVYGNHDPGVCACYTNAAMLWLLGYAEQARTQIEYAMVLIHRHTQSVFIAHGLMHCCMPYMLLGDTIAVREILARVQPLAIETANQGQMSECEFTLGWALAVDGEYANAIAQMEGGLAAQPPAASRYYYCYFLSILADACYRNGQFYKGQDYLHQAIEEANTSGERWWEAELHRLEGHAHLLTNDRSLNSARESFQLALDVSRKQGAKMLELRAAIDLFRLLREQGECQGTFDLLVPVYEWFTEGFDSADLREAKALLEELS